MKKLTFLFSAVLCAAMSACSVPTQNDYRVIPLPNHIVMGEGEGFKLDEGTVIVCENNDSAMLRNAAFLAEYIDKATDLEVKVKEGKANGRFIVLKKADISDNKEAYNITVNSDSVVITGASDAGVFYGIQTLRKSLPAVKGDVILSPVEINDAPRFGYRGAMLDVSRHFFPADSVKKFIDMLALHNINRLHWHITDDQGWRIEIKKYPELTKTGSQRAQSVVGRNTDEYDGKPHGGFYTQQEARDIVKYAADRHITVIPEIDLPGHMQAALATYPELGCTGGPYKVRELWGISDDVLCIGNPKTLPFITDVLDEITEIFPSEYIHIGGDECPKIRWEHCPKCKAKMASLRIRGDRNHTAAEKLQSYVISYVEKHLNAKGRRIIGWDEILEGGLAPNATVMSWRGTSGGYQAAALGHDVIMTPNIFLYFDYYQARDTENEPLAIGGYIPIEKVYSFEPIHQGLTPTEAARIKGIQANLWTEYIPTYSQVEYMELPRMAALSEIQWTTPENKNYKDFLSRVPHLVDAYDLAGYNYATHVFDPIVTFTPDSDKGTIKVNVSTIDGAPIYYTLDGQTPTTKSTEYTGEVSIAAPCTFKAVVIRPSGQSRVFTEKVSFNKATAKKITMLQPINKTYEFNGAQTLVDGLSGDKSYRTGRWIGFVGNPLEAVIDMGNPTEISKAHISTFVEKGDWIFDADAFAIYSSNDGVNYKEVAIEKYPEAEANDPNGIFEHELTFDPVKARYFKVRVDAVARMPKWHVSAGKPGYVFVDEISLY